MITLIEALNYRCLKYVRHTLEPFQVLVGPNATGKTTFLDVIGFLGDLVAKGLEAAVAGRTNTPSDLTWWRKGTSFKLAIEATFPDAFRVKLENPNSDRIRYEIAVGMDVAGQGIGITTERVLLKVNGEPEDTQRDLFPQLRASPPTILSRKGLSRKEALLAAIRAVGKSRTSKLYADLAGAEGELRPEATHKDFLSVRREGRIAA